ncbi:MAG TPA: TonB-dependent receptor, partial [Gammaproteobacteria bacterium]|nr:TonB-dependent receptor [Gammaproteobacteria bacterium]
MPSKKPVFILITVITIGLPAQAQQQIQEIQVIGREVNMVGLALSASEGRVSYNELLQRPLMRAGDVLESVPGLVATQHSGNGKANQFFLRGFNLDHGTDFATTVDGMPVNMRSHGHGQGYTDLNF